MNVPTLHAHNRAEVYLLGAIAHHIAGDRDGCTEAVRRALAALDGDTARLVLLAVDQAARTLLAHHNPTEAARTLASRCRMLDALDPGDPTDGTDLP